MAGRSRVKQFTTLILGGLALAGGGCALFLGTLNINGNSSSNDAWSIVGALLFGVGLIMLAIAAISAVVIIIMKVFKSDGPAPPNPPPDAPSTPGAPGAPSIPGAPVAPGAPQL